MCDDCDYSDDDEPITGDEWRAPRFDLVETALGSEVAPPDIRPAWRRRLRVPKIGRGTAFALGLVVAELVRVLL
jgi:hypothetical protein